MHHAKHDIFAIVARIKAQCSVGSSASEPYKRFFALANWFFAIVARIKARSSVG